MTNKPRLRDHIVDTALALAEQDCWECLRLHDIASALGISLNDIRIHFREKEDIGDAWFDRADATMLKRSEAPDFTALDISARIHALTMTWFNALAEHRKATREILLGKLEPGHLHIQIPGLMRVSRTVQWIREAAGCDASFVRRALEESELTAMYLLSFAHWLWDDSSAHESTSRFLERRLASARWLPRARPFKQAVRNSMPQPTS